jgi:hypothetical protein
MARGGFKITSKGDFKNTLGFLKDLENFDGKRAMDKTGQYGREQFGSATPVDTGHTASSWLHWIVPARGKFPHALIWTNDAHAGSRGARAPIPLLRQYGHATRDGGRIPGFDYYGAPQRQVAQMFEQEIMNEYMKLSRRR